MLAPKESFGLPASLLPKFKKRRKPVKPRLHFAVTV
jgi:hypothetical protein